MEQARKYDPIKQFLAASTETEHTLSLKQVEIILRTALPNSAGAHEEWWNPSGRSTSSHTDAWASIGWEAKPSRKVSDEQGQQMTDEQKKAVQKVTFRKRSGV
jgi:dipeptidyl aminopeptidase/acylaminoacyl peptidase